MSNNHRSLSAFRVVFLGQLSSRSAYFTVQSISGAVHVKSVIFNHCVFCKVTQGKQVNLFSYGFTRSHLCSSGHFCPVRYGLLIPLNVVFTFYVTPDIFLNLPAVSKKMTVCQPVFEPLAFVFPPHQRCPVITCLEKVIFLPTRQSIMLQHVVLSNFKKFE